MERNVIHTGDAFDVLEDLDDESVHAVICDPPYGLAFMGRDWDDFEPKEYQEWCEVWASRAKRVLKPGGHLLAFSGNRTHHRLFTGVEDAGFEIRDTLTWHFGSGFPKATDVSKTIDKRKDKFEEEKKKLGAWLREQRDASGLAAKEVAKHFPSENGNITGCVSNWELGYNTPTPDQWETLREVIGFGDGMDGFYAELRERTGEPSPDWYDREVIEETDQEAMTGSVYGEDSDMTGGFDVTAPATDAAKKWDGWKTGLKPATEFVVMARKPFDGATVDCVLEHGTGALNIDETRVGGDVDTSRENSGEIGDGTKYHEAPDPDMTAGSETGGRYPSNVAFDETAAAQLDADVGELDAGYHLGNSDPKDGEHLYGDSRTAGEKGGYDDGGGGPSRFFYTSKASRSERTENGAIENDHPTVKPADLMEWLIRLVTREGQTVLDPFAGSGTTCKAAKALGREFIGIERQAKYADIARVRCGLTPDDPSVVRDDDGQHGLEAYADGGEP